MVICGATATGKSALAMALAEDLGELEIVCADSRQVYRGMDIGTAKPSTEDRARVPHHGLDLVDPDEPFSVADYRRHARDALVGIAQRGRSALLVGGSGLYLRAVARDLPLDEVAPDPELRAELERRLQEEGSGSLARQLVRTAPQLAATTDLANPRRVIRALERSRQLGDRPPARPRGYPGRVLWLGLSLEPDEHRARILQRATEQFEDGFLEEVKHLTDRYDPGLPAFSAVGYREAVEHLQGRMTLAEAIETTVRRTWAYARRQRTWFRRESAIQWLPGTDAAGRANELVEGFLGRSR